MKIKDVQTFIMSTSVTEINHQILTYSSSGTAQVFSQSSFSNPLVHCLMTFGYTTLRGHIYCSGSGLSFPNRLLGYCCIVLQCNNSRGVCP